MSKYKNGNIVNGTVTGIEKYGIFVKLDEFYSGLIHISEISSGFVKDINQFVAVGEVINVKILDLDENTCHAKLSIKGFNYKPTKKHRLEIRETNQGFQPLKENLDDWIYKKLAEIKKNS